MLFRKAVHNVFFSLIGFAWPTLLLFVSTPLLLRGLGEAGFGIQALITNIIGYLVLFNSFQSAGTKYLSEYLAKNETVQVNRLLNSGLLFNGTIGLLGATAIFGAAQTLVRDVFVIPAPLAPQALAAFQIAAIGVFFSTITWWANSVFAGVQRYDWLTGVSILVLSVTTLGGLAALGLGWGLIGVVGAAVLAMFLGAVTSVAAVHSLLPMFTFAPRWDREMLQRLFGFGIFTTLQVIFGLVAVQLDRTLLGIWVGAPAVALYVIPWGIATRIHQLCAKALEVVFPITSMLDAQGKQEQLKHLFLRAQTLNVVLVMMLGAPLVLYAREILLYWIGPDFAQQATWILQLLTIGYGLLALNVVIAGMTPGFGFPQLTTAFTLFAALFNLIGFIFFIPRWGAEGAALAIVCGFGLATPLFYWSFQRRLLPIPWWQVLMGAYARPVLAGLVSGIILCLLRPALTSGWMLLFLLALSLPLYLLATLLLGVWEAQELTMVRNLGTRVQGALKSIS